MPRDALAKLVWGDPDTGTSRTIDVHIGRLRVKLSRRAARRRRSSRCAASATRSSAAPRRIPRRMIRPTRPNARRLAERAFVRASNRSRAPVTASSHERNPTLIVAARSNRYASGSTRRVSRRWCHCRQEAAGCWRAVRRIRDWSLSRVAPAASSLTLLGAVCSASRPWRRPSPLSPGRDPSFFPATGYRISSPALLDYFQHRGGVRTFGYPVSNEFPLLGQRVQIFQRQMLSSPPTAPSHRRHPRPRHPARSRHIDGLSLPAGRPGPGRRARRRPARPTTTVQALAFVNLYVPDDWNGLPVNFQTDVPRTRSPAPTPSAPTRATRRHCPASPSSCGACRPACPPPTRSTRSSSTSASSAASCTSRARPG